jgi:hypothetical protein
MDDELIIELDIPMPPDFPENESNYDSFHAQPSYQTSFPNQHSLPNKQSFQPSFQNQQSFQPTIPNQSSYQESIPNQHSYAPPSVPFPKPYIPPSSLKIPPSFHSVEMPELYTPKSNMSYQSQSEIQYEPQKNTITPVNQVTQFEGTELKEQEQEEAWYAVITKSLSEHAVIIHSIADLIFFYMFFKYTRNKYAETQTKIEDTREHIKKIQRQYGLNAKRISQ